jgi:pimeloyl-ACP methyl ester carboxylesterase
MILFGLGQVGAASRFRERREGREHRRWPRFVRFVGVLASLVVALGLLLVSSLVHRGTSSPDAFYTPPKNVAVRPGLLLRSDSFTTGIPSGARAWRILYTTTTADGHPAVASGVVVVAKDAPSTPRPVIAWAHGTTGFASKCAPSLVSKGLEAGALPALDQVIANKWVLVATDYVGLGTRGPHPYLIGQPEARSVLDSVRAAHQLRGLNLQKQTVVWGHSQGGGAALWTGILAPTYAPGDDVIGVAALSPATELPTIFDAIKDSPVGKIMGPYVLAAYSAYYPGVHFDDYVRSTAQVVAHATANRCLSGPEALVSVVANLNKESIFSRGPSSGPLGKALQENIPLHPIKAPLFIGQGLTDALVLPSAQKTYVDAMCKAGQQLEYRTYQGYDHVGVVLDRRSPLIPDLIRWTKDRLAGKAPPAGCVFTRR